MKRSGLGLTIIALIVVAFFIGIYVVPSISENKRFVQLEEARSALIYLSHSDYAIDDSFTAVSMFISGEGESSKQRAEDALREIENYFDEVKRIRALVEYASP